MIKEIKEINDVWEGKNAIKNFSLFNNKQRAVK